MLSKDFEEKLDRKISIFQRRVNAGKEDYHPTLKVLKFLKKHHYLSLKCLQCGKNFVCTGFCLLTALRIIRSAGCFCGACDSSELSWKSKCKKGNSLFQIFALVAEQERLERKKNVK